MSNTVDDVDGRPFTAQVKGRSVGRPCWSGLTAFALLAGAASMTYSPPATAQTSDCTYATCALRLKEKFFTSGEIVRGRDEEHVATIWFFAPTIAPLAERADSSGYYYRSFRTLHNRGTWLGLTGAAMLLAGMLIGRGDNDVLAGTMVLGSLVPITWGFIDLRRGRDRLGRAIWWYNGTVAR